MKFRDYFTYLPQKVYVYYILSFFISIVHAFSVYGIAVSIQVFTAIIGFTTTDQINERLIFIAQDTEIFFIIFILIVLLNGISTFFQSYINLVFSEVYKFQVRTTYFNFIFNRSNNLKMDQGQMSNILAEIIPMSSNFLSSSMRFFSLSIQIITIGFLCLFYLPLQFIIVMISFVIISPFFIYLNKINKKLGNNILEESEILNKNLMQSIKNIVFLKILGLEKKQNAEVQESSEKYFNIHKKSSLVESMATTIPISFSILLIVFLFYNFSIRVENSANLITLFYLIYKFTSYVSQSLSITNNLSAYLPHYKSIIKSFKKISQDEQLQITEDNKEKISQYNLELTNLSFNYFDLEKNQNFSIFQNINLKIDSGSCLVIRGVSGSGKTTLLMNLMGMLNNYKGEILWGGKNLKKIDMQDFKNKIGYVGPESYIIKGSILENIKYGIDNDSVSKITEEDVYNACKIACINKEFFEGEEENLNKQLNSFGEGLSMGQKQRLSLARAILRKPNILFLDEITANLDIENEKKIISNLNNLKNQTTVIIATHSNNFKIIADKTINIEDFK